MILDDQLPELEMLRAVEANLQLRADTSFSQLVVAAQNYDLPIHRWFKFKESFSPQLLKTVVDVTYPTLPATLSTLDPFVGVGTTLLAAQDLASKDVAIQAVGIERNPFIAFAARTKVNWASIDSNRLVERGEQAVRSANHLRPTLPALTSIRTGRCISRHNSMRLIAIRDAIRRIADGPTRDALLLGLAASVEPLSRTRKDGRALRIVDRPHSPVSATLRKKWWEIASDCRSQAVKKAKLCTSVVIEGDGRVPSLLGVKPTSIDLVFTSPPYPNNIDYNEVYKLELWLLGFVDDVSDFLNLRRQTFRSHPTCAIPSPGEDFTFELEQGQLRSLLGPILDRAKHEAWRHRLFIGYFSDMWTSLKGVHECLKIGGHAVFVVGNSLHGGSDSAYLVPTDLLVARMAQCLGFEIRASLIARTLKRRLAGNHFLRESIIILRKPDGRSAR